MNSHGTAVSNTEGQRLLRRPEVSVRTGLGRSAIYAYIKAGSFPPPVRLGPRAVAWVDAEISDWIRCRTAERDAERA